MRPLIFLSIIIFCSCDMNNKNVEGKLYPELNKAFEDTLKVETTSFTITRMELEITGNLKGKGKLYYSHVPFIRKQFIDLEGDVNKKVETKWYDERCLILYEPENSLVKGEIVVNFKVY